MKNKIMLSLVLGGTLSLSAGVVGLNLKDKVNLANAEEISSEVVADVEVEPEYLITDGGSLTITAEGEIGEIVVESGGSLVVESSVIIENLYIYPGASVSLDGCILSNMTIEYGEGYSADSIKLGETSEMICAYVSLLVPAGTSSGEISLPSVASVCYDADEGFYFGAWTEEDSDGCYKCLGSFNGQTFTPATTYNYTSTNKDVELIAGGTDTSVDAIAFITSVNNPTYGTITESAMYSTVQGYFNKQVKVEFSANEGYEVSLVKVNNEEVSIVSPYIFSTSETSGINTFSVEFAEARKVEYAINTTAGAGGTITESFTREEGSSAEVLITANTGYEIAEIKVNGSSLAEVAGLANYTYSINALTENVTIEATFKIKQYTINMYAGLGGAISGSATVNHGENAVVTITPSEGYKIKSLTVDGVDTTVASSYTFESVTASHSVQVEFEKIKYTIETASNANGTILAPSIIEHGESVVATITPNDGYIITNVRVNGTDVSYSLNNGVASVTITSVKSNQVIEATYSLAEYLVSVKTDLGVTAKYNEVAGYNETAEIELVVIGGYKVTGITRNGEELDASAVEAIVEEGKMTITNICANVNVVISAEQVVYTITYNLNGGVNDKENLQTFTISNLGETLINPSRVGYRFKGWKVGDEIVSTLKITNELLKDLTLSAEWEEVDLSSTSLSAGKIVGALSGGAVLTGGMAVGAILALKKKKWFD